MMAAENRNTPSIALSNGLGSVSLPLQVEADSEHGHTGHGFNEEIWRCA